jgi:anti-sigma regulatory factor (Ser/Thr protein kinase)
MPRFIIPNSATIHHIRSFLEKSSPFEDDGTGEAVLELHPKWVHMEPVALAMAAAWGQWAQRKGYELRVENLGPHARYVKRMGLFDLLGVDFSSEQTEHEPSGRFMPLARVREPEEVRRVVAAVSALLHLENEPETLGAVQFCVSELLRNVLEHSGSPEGAFVCANRYTGKNTRFPRVTLAVADCGQGIASHLSRSYKEAAEDDSAALGLALRYGVTGALPGVYGGTPDNAGAGLFVTRSIAKATGGCFLAYSGRAAYRLRRARTEDEMTELFLDPFDEPHRDVYSFRPWRGTVVSVEIFAEKIGDYEGLFQWIRQQVPQKTSSRNRIRFT